MPGSWPDVMAVTNLPNGRDRTKSHLIVRDRRTWARLFPFGFRALACRAQYSRAFGARISAARRDFAYERLLYLSG